MKKDALDEYVRTGGLARRDFLKIAGGGIVVAVSLDELSGLQEARRQGPTYPEDFNAYLRVGEDGRVTGYTGKIEMGQGAITSLPQMIADELDVPIDAVDMIMGDTDLCPYDMGTFGSMTTRYFGPALRAAAAEARAVLLELASEKLGVPKERLAVRDGIVREKVTGKALFTGDIRLPGMLYAKILRPPAHGATLRSLDASAAEKNPGAKVLRDGDLVAVLHELPDAAESALALIKADYDVPEAKIDTESIFDHLRAVAPEGRVVAEGGDLAKGEEAAVSRFDETYLNGYVAHAPMEPHTALADVKADRATVWASTQAPFRLKEEVAQTLGVPPGNVRVFAPFVGGGFGGKTRNIQAVQAVRLSKLAGKPVQVAWSRGDEFFNDSFRPAAVVRIKSGMDGAGRIVHWDYDVLFAGDRSSAQFYDIPNHRTVSRGQWGGGAGGAHPFAVGAWRAPGSNTNVFARECHIDIMAAKAGTDPLEFRLRNLADERMKRVLRAAAEKFGWKAAASPSGRGVAIVTSDYLGTYVATAAEVDVDRNSGRVRVKRVVCAQDMGQCVNPQGALIQVEGCVMMGLGYALTEEIRFKGGEVRDLNFDSYEIPRFSWLPKIEAFIVPNDGLPASGGGEPAIINMGAVVANAVFDATGARLFRLPMTPARVIEALAGATKK
jgi:nicotinate dehydrogenase subunit B